MAHYNHSCVVTLKAKNCDGEGTGSGLIIDTSQGFVVTHASLLGAIVLKDKHLKEAVTSQELDGCVKYINSKENVEITLERRVKDNKTMQNVIKSNNLTSLLNSSSEDRYPDYSVHTGSVVSIFKCAAFENAVKYFTPRSNWKFADVSDDQPSNSSTSSSSDQHSLEATAFTLLPYFILLKVNDWISCKSNLLIRSSRLCRSGDPVEIQATPFGNLFPGALINSCSRGIVSNLAGKNQCLIFTDARCIPGCEGGPLYSVVDDKKYLIGIIVATLCWKNSEWIGLSLACSIDLILDSLNRNGVLVNSINQTFPNIRKGTDSVDHILAMFENIALIKLDNFWGSGIIVDPARCLVLTCSHVVKRNNKVYLKRKRKAPLTECDVLWRSPLGEQFDLAVLSYANHPSQNHQLQAPSFIPYIPKEGSLVYVIGHGCFGPSDNLFPSVTTGVISKVVCVNSIPVIIQTTCAVHAGASGGALIDKDGHLLGIVVCNAKDISSGACFPHVNMSIPMITIWPVVHKYCMSQDISVLNKLHLKNQIISDLWTLGNQTGVAQFSSRL